MKVWFCCRWKDKDPNSPHALPNISSACNFCMYRTENCLFGGMNIYIYIYFVVFCLANAKMSEHIIHTNHLVVRLFQNLPFPLRMYIWTGQQNSQIIETSSATTPNTTIIHTNNNTNDDSMKSKKKKKKSPRLHNGSNHAEMCMCCSTKSITICHDF